MSNADQPAFAFVDPHVGEGRHVYPGLTKREQLAAMAMQGIVSASGHGNGEVDYDDEIVARSAVAMADALLAELAKGKP